MLANPLAKTVNTEQSTLNVVVLYEDLETGKQAKRTYDHLVQAIGNDTQFTNSMWKFDVLTIPKLREIAAKDAAMADIVIVSGHGAERLPAYVQLWADQWLTLNGNCGALVALFDGPTDRSAGARGYLESIAIRGKMEFFAQPTRLSEPQLQPAIHPSVLSHLAQEDYTAGRRDAALSIPRWGINE